MSLRSESKQSRSVRRELADVVGKHGPEILDDTRRVRAMLADAVAGATAEINLVGLALGSGVADRLRTVGNDPKRVTDAVEETARELEQTGSVQREDARWAVSAVAEALGLRVAPDDSAPTPEAASGSKGYKPHSTKSDTSRAGPEDLLLRVGGREHVARTGSIVTIGRDADCTIVVESPAVSRQHGRLTRGGGGWEYRDEGSTQGSFVNGVAVSTFRVQDEVELTLGQGRGSVRMDLVPFGLAETRRPKDRQRPGGHLAAGGAPRTELGQGPSEDSLTVSLGSATRTIAPSESLTIGRETGNDMLAGHSTVSRHHVRVEHGSDGWRLRDLGSRSGTWLAGSRVADVRLSGRQEFVLGDAKDGDRLVTRTAGSAPNQDRRGGAILRRLTRPQVIVAVAVLFAVLTGLLVWQAFTDGERGVDQVATRDELAQATVFVDAGGVTGSGVIIDREEGLILTNAHVAAPSAVGLGIDQLMFADTQEPNPSDLVIHVSGGLDQSAEPMFVAKLVASDGYLDVAVLRIEEKLSGTPVDDDDLAELTEVTLGDSDAVRSSDPISFLGYPGAASSTAPTFTTGVVSGPVADVRLDTARAALNTTATSSPGNSGGLAVDASGRMVGVPTWGRRTNDGDLVLSSIRPINLAKPVIDAVRKDEDYVSPWSVPGPSSAQVSPDLRYGVPGEPGTATAGCEQGTAGDAPLAIAVEVSGFPGGEHTDMLAVLFDEEGSRIAGALAEYPTELPSTGCVTLTFDDAIPAGSYGLKIGVGGDLRVVYEDVIQLG